MPRSVPWSAEAPARLGLRPSALDDQEAPEVAGLQAAQAAELFAEFGSLPEVLSATTAALSRRRGRFAFRPRYPRS